jgi:hypothetical protein
VSLLAVGSRQELAWTEARVVLFNVEVGLDTLRVFGNALRDASYTDAHK